MDSKKINILLFIASVGLAVSGIIFLLAVIFDEERSKWALAAALFCTALSNLFNIIRIQHIKKK